MTSLLPPAFKRIHTGLARVRRRLRVRALLVSAGVGLAAWLGLTLLWLLAALALGPAGDWFGVAFWISILAGAAAWFRYTLWRPWRRVRTDAQVAAHVEMGLPALADGLLASVQFGREWGTPAAQDPKMVGALAAQVADALDEADLSALTPFTPAKRPWMFAAGALGLWVLLLVSMPGDLCGAGVPSTTEGQAARSTGPLVGDLTLTLHFPEHVGRPPQTIPNSEGRIEAPKGTRVQVQATTLAPALAVSLRFGEGESATRQGLRVVDGRDASGEFVVDRAGTWRFEIEDAEGIATETEARRIHVQLDKPPKVQLVEPSEDIELEDLRAVPIVFSAEDDFGLSRVTVTLALAEDPEHPTRTDQPAVSGRRFGGEDEVDLTVIEARPGDRIALTIEAWDNNGVDGPQRGASVTRYITVRDPQAAHYALTERLRQTIELLLTALADRLELDWLADAPLRPRLEAVAVSAAKAVEALSAIVVAMTGDPLTPKEVRLALTGRLGTLEMALDVEGKTIGSLGQAIDEAQPAAVARATAKNERVIEALEQAIVLVEAMVARLAMEDMAALTEELNAARGRLRDLIQQYKDRPSEALKARIMRDIQRLRARMKALRERMAQLRQKLPEEFLNLDGLKKDDIGKGLAKTESQLDALEKMLDEGRIDEALAALDEMSAALDEMASALDKDMDELHNSSNPEMQKALSELMDQTRDLMQRQEKISKETEAMAKAEAKRQKEMLEKELKDQLDQVVEKATKLRLEVEGLAPVELPSYMEDELRHLQTGVDTLRDALERKRLMEAVEMADRTLGHLKKLDRFMRVDREAQQNRAHLREGLRLDTEIIKDLAKMMQQAREKQQQAKGEDGQKSEALSKQQQDVSKAAEKLKQRLGESAQKVPGMGEEISQRIEKAGQAMDEASKQLRKGRPGQARPGQQQAMSELKQVMEGLKGANKPKSADRGQKRQGQKHRQEKVRIPGADEYEAPEAFRKELMEAMKERPPEAFREQVKRYYESLVQ